jgi:O-antigen ligase
MCRKVTLASVAAVRGWLYPVATAGLITAGNFKDNPMLDFVPVDLTLAWAVIVSGCIGYELIRRGIPEGSFSVILGFVLLVPSVFIAAPDDYGVEKISRFFTLTLLAALAPIVLIGRSRDLERHLWAWTGMATVVVVSAIVNPRQGGGVDELGAGSNGVDQVTAQGVDTIALGSASAIVVITMVLGALWRRLPGLVVWPLAAAAAYTLLQSGSRGPLLALAAALAAAAVFSRARPDRRRAAVIGGVFLVGIAVSFAAATPVAQKRILDFLQGRTSGTDVETRQFLYDIATKSIVEHPFGIGWGNFRQIAFARYVYPHNLFLEVLDEMGTVFGGAFLLWLVFQVVRARAGTVDYAGATSFALLLFLVGAASVSGGLNDDRVVFYSIGLTVVARVLVAHRSDGPAATPARAHRPRVTLAISAPVTQRSPASSTDQ